MAVWELEAMRALNHGGRSPHCIHKLDEFIFPGKGADGEHLCLVTPVMGGDVRSLIQKYSVFPLPLAKRIALHLLRGIAFAHSSFVMHTDIKHDNILFTCLPHKYDIGELLAEDPSRRHPPEDSWEGKVQAAVSQPFPLPTLEEASELNFVLADFGSGADLSFVSFWSRIHRHCSATCFG